MSRKNPREILLIEPNYKNKYPPMGLMKLSTYYKNMGDNVRFFKGDLLDLVSQLLCEDLFKILRGSYPERQYVKYTPDFIKYIRYGKTADIPDILSSDEEIIEWLKIYRQKFKSKDYFNNPRFDVVCVTTLFTFYWKQTIETINFVKNLCKNKKNVLIGGVVSSIVPEYIEKETGIKPIIGILDTPGILDKKSKVIIDTLPLDYSILYEIEYEYPATEAYFAYMTRGCVNKCKFCAVPKIEPQYQNYIPLKKQLEITNYIYGEQRHLLLLDNNVFASNCFEKIIDEIKSCGFEKGARYTPPNQYEIAIKNLKNSINDRAYIKLIVEIYHILIDKCRDEKIRIEIYSCVHNSECDNIYTATKENILQLDEFISPLYNKYVYHNKSVQRYVDFNQGVDARLITKEKTAKLAEIAIRPLRIAFDNWASHKLYENAVRLAANAKIHSLSNYMLYNFEDKPIELYRRMRLTVDLCEELDITIYSFPMKYHPIDDPNYFRNREYIGKHWNRKFIRAIQAVLNSTHGKIGRGLKFFKAAFGDNEDKFEEILLMPEALIIRRYQHDESLRLKNPEHCKPEYTSRATDEWREKFYSLSPQQKEKILPIIYTNHFSDEDIQNKDKEIFEVLKFYQMSRYE
jgi:hypothetical protein